MGKHRSRRVRAVVGAVAAVALVAVASGTGTRADAKPKVELFKDINPGVGSSSPQSMTDLNGSMLFAADDGAHGSELWKSDGTQVGTALVHDENLQNCSSFTQQTTCGFTAGPFVPLGNHVFFTGNDGLSYGNQLWMSDGTSEQIIQSVSGVSYPVEPTASGNTMFFYGTSNGYGHELWKTDGTWGGTVMVKDINPGQVGSAVDDSYDPDLTNVNGTLFFSADDGMHGHELWKSDGTAAGTVMVKDINLIPNGTVSLSGSSNPGCLANVNGTLFFQATDGVHGYELWKSDGTAAGTVMVKDINPALQMSSDPCKFTDVNGTAFFVADDGVHGQELWKTDGTDAGTVMVKDINPGSAHSFPQLLTNVAGRLFFVADDGVHGFELWTSDGTDAGTHLVKDIHPGNANDGWYPSQLTDVNGTLFFAANDGLHGNEVWTSDGTEAGTAEYADINLGPGSSNPSGFHVFNGYLYFAANDGVTGSELWRTALPRR
jgi:ELWxxDGT repeat protein